MKAALLRLERPTALYWVWPLAAGIGAMIPCAGIAGLTPTGNVDGVARFAELLVYAVPYIIAVSAGGRLVPSAFSLALPVTGGERAVAWLLPSLARKAIAVVLPLVALALANAAYGVPVLRVAIGLVTLAAVDSLGSAIELAASALRAVPRPRRVLVEGVGRVGLVVVALAFPSVSLAVCALAGTAAIAAWVHARAPLATTLVTDDAPLRLAPSPFLPAGKSALVYDFTEYRSHAFFVGSWALIGWFFGSTAIAMLSMWTWRIFLFDGEGLHQHLALVDALPVARRSVLARRLLPTAIVVLLVSFVGPLASGRRSNMNPHWGLVDLRPAVSRDAAGNACSTQASVEVPPDLWKVTLGAPPVVTAADGESWRPTAYRVLGRIHTYNPYEVGPANSEAFVAHQVARAMHDVYGVTRSPDEVRARYLDGYRWRAGDSGGLDDDFDPEAREPNLARKVSPGRLGASVLFYLLSWLLSLGVVTRPPLRSVTTFAIGIRYATVGAAVGVIALLAAGPPFASLGGPPFFWGACTRSLVDALDAAPLFAVLAPVALAAFGYWLIARRVDAMEVVPPPAGTGWLQSL